MLIFSKRFFSQAARGWTTKNASNLGKWSLDLPGIYWNIGRVRSDVSPVLLSAKERGMISFNGNCQFKCRFQRINTPFRSFARRFQYLPVLLSRLFLVTFLKAYFSKEIRNYLGFVPPERIPCMKEYIRVKNWHSAVVKTRKVENAFGAFFSNIFSDSDGQKTKKVV